MGVSGFHESLDSRTSRDQTWWSLSASNTLASCVTHAPVTSATTEMGTSSPRFMSGTLASTNFFEASVETVPSNSLGWYTVGNSPNCLDSSLNPPLPSFRPPLRKMTV